MFQIFQGIWQVLSLLRYLESGGIVEVFIEGKSIGNLSKAVKKH